MTESPRSIGAFPTTLETNGVRLHAMTAGPQNGPLVLLLHGFPDFWYGWRRQIEPLACAGLRVVAPDQRGYGASDKPRGARAYALDTLAADVIGMIDALGRDRAALVGHDWGGAVAWWTAIRHPDRVARLAVLNCPHPLVFRRALRRNPRQILRSWYMTLFQLPRLPEALLGIGDHALLIRGLRGTALADEEDVAAYREAWSAPGALTAMVDWYRAMRRHPPRIPSDVRVRVPALLLWGARDRYLGREMAAPSIAMCDDGELAVIEDATHWIQLDAAAEVNRRLIAFLGAALT